MVATRDGHFNSTIITVPYPRRLKARFDALAEEAPVDRKLKKDVRTALMNAFTTVPISLGGRTGVLNVFKLVKFYSIKSEVESDAQFLKLMRLQRVVGILLQGLSTKYNDV